MILDMFADLKAEEYYRKSSGVIDELIDIIFQLHPPLWLFSR